MGKMAVEAGRVSSKLDLQAAVLAASYLIDEIEALPHGWGRKVRVRKKRLQKALRQGLRELRRMRGIGPKAEWATASD